MISPIIPTMVRIDCTRKQFEDICYQVDNRRVISIIYCQYRPVHKIAYFCIEPQHYCNFKTIVEAVINAIDPTEEPVVM